VWWTGCWAPAVARLWAIPAGRRELAACSMGHRGHAASAVHTVPKHHANQHAEHHSQPREIATRGSRTASPPPHADHRKAMHPIVVDLIHRSTDSPRRSLWPREVEIGEQRMHIGIWSKSLHVSGFTT
jgi:hypothetical protein